jgi:hypothetical protein
MGQRGLAHPRLALGQHHAAIPAESGRQPAPQLGQLSVTPDETTAEVESIDVSRHLRHCRLPGEVDALPGRPR